MRLQGPISGLVRLTNATVLSFRIGRDPMRDMGSSSRMDGAIDEYVLHMVIALLQMQCGEKKKGIFSSPTLCGIVHLCLHVLRLIEVSFYSLRLGGSQWHTVNIFKNSTHQCS